MSLGAHVILMGLRGSGKSTVGAALASRLKAAFTDLDDITLARLGCSTVSEAWTTRGEAAFREAETEALIDVLGEPPGVIALGGGTPTAPGAASILRGAIGADSMLVYLRCAPAELAARLVSDPGDRPALVGEDAVSEVAEVFARRDSLYRALASHVIEGAADIEATLRRIEALL